MRRALKATIVGGILGFVAGLIISLIRVKGGVSVLAGIGTIGVALMIAYIEILKPWMQKPEIEIEFENKLPFCRDLLITDEEKNEYFIRLRIKNTGGSAAKNLRGKLVEVIDKDGKPHKDFDPLFLHWVPMTLMNGLDIYARYLDPIDLNAEEWEYLDVFHTFQKGVDYAKTDLLEQKEDLVHIGTTPEDRGCNINFRMSAELKAFKITIYGENIEPVTETYKLVWDGKNYDEIKMYKIE